MAQRLLVVALASASLIGKGVQLCPSLPLDFAPKESTPLRLRVEPCPVVLRRPDGTMLATTVRTGSLHVVPVVYSDPHWYTFYWLPEVQPDQVPPGTQLWVEEEYLS